MIRKAVEDQIRWLENEMKKVEEAMAALPKEAEEIELRLLELYGIKKQLEDG